MSKKQKSVFVLADDFKAMITVVPKLEAFLKIHNDIAISYQKYRNNGGASIPGIEKHMGIKKQPVIPPLKAKKAEKTAETKAPKKGGAVKKTIKAKA